MVWPSKRCSTSGMTSSRRAKVKSRRWDIQNAPSARGIPRFRRETLPSRNRRPFGTIIWVLEARSPGTQSSKMKMTFRPVIAGREGHLTLMMAAWSRCRATRIFRSEVRTHVQGRTQNSWTIGLELRAEREGFEPSVSVTVHGISSAVAERKRPRFGIDKIV